MILQFLSRRIFFSIVALFALLILVFLMARLTGDPAYLYLPDTATEEMRNQFREVHGFNDPILVQLGRYIWSALQLDFGMSLRRNIPAMQAVAEAFPWTLRLAGITVVLAMIVAMIVGPLAAYKPGSIFDRFASVISLAAASMPDFWLAITAILVFRGLARRAADLRHRRPGVLDTASGRADVPHHRYDNPGGTRLHDIEPRRTLREGRQGQGYSRQADSFRSCTPKFCHCCGNRSR